MASATEIKREATNKGLGFEAYMLVRPPLKLRGNELGESIARIVFGGIPQVNAESVELIQLSKLGNLAQIVMVRTYDNKSGHPGETCNTAVDLLNQYVTGMAEGDIEALQEFFP